MNLMPIITFNTARGQFTSDIYSRLLDERIIILDDEINNLTASSVVAQMLALEANDPKKDIQLWINSGGGVVTAGMAIIDVMDYVKCDMAVVCNGICASMASVILSNGTPGKRYIFPNASVMIHQVKGGAIGSTPDVEVSVERLRDLNEQLICLLAYNCGREAEEVMKMTERDCFMTAQTALEFGIVDEIIKTGKPSGTEIANKLWYKGGG